MVPHTLLFATMVPGHVCRVFLDGDTVPKEIAHNHVAGTAGHFEGKNIFCVDLIQRRVLIDIWSALVMRPIGIAIRGTVF